MGKVTEVVGQRQGTKGHKLCTCIHPGRGSWDTGHLSGRALAQPSGQMGLCAENRERKPAGSRQLPAGLGGCQGLGAKWRRDRG